MYVLCSLLRPGRATRHAVSCGHSWSHHKTLCHSRKAWTNVVRVIEMWTVLCGVIMSQHTHSHTSQFCPFFTSRLLTSDLQAKVNRCMLTVPLRRPSGGVDREERSEVRGKREVSDESQALASFTPCLHVWVYACMGEPKLPASMCLSVNNVCVKCNLRNHVSISGT